MDGVQTKDLEHKEIGKLIIGPPGTIFYKKNIKGTVNIETFHRVENRLFCSTIQPLIFPNNIDLASVFVSLPLVLCRLGSTHGFQEELPRP